MIITMWTTIRKNLDSLEMSDIYSLLFFVLYKINDIPEYAVVSELCYLVDSRSLTRMLAYFAGKTIKIPTTDELKILTNALLLYQKINIERETYAEAITELTNVSKKELEKITNLYLKTIDIMNNYNINGRTIGGKGIKSDAR